jgi:hypothetical protein
MSGGPREYEEAAKVLDDARRRLYAILAGEQAGHVGPEAAGGVGNAGAGDGASGTDSTETTGGTEPAGP